jgi:hypothetical protein
MAGRPPAARVIGRGERAERERERKKRKTFYFTNLLGKIDAID